MYLRVSRLTFNLLLVVWLAACATAPKPHVAAAGSSPEPSPAPVATAGALPASPPAEASPSVTTGPDDQPLPAGEVQREFQRGGASWYGPRFHGRRTASGERYDMNGFTAAHRSLPFGTMVRVRSLVSGLEVDVRINDRGPFSRMRIIDVSRAAADQLGMLTVGVKDVVLLIPESTPVPLEMPAKPTKRTNRSARAR